MIQHIQWSKELREYCGRLEREGMYKRAIEIAKWMIEDERSPQEVMKGVGMLQALAIGSKTDCYWNEKVHHGYHKFLEEAEMSNIKNKKSL